MNKQNIITKLHGGLKRAYCKSVLFSEKLNEIIKTEYLVTVSIADYLSDNGLGMNTPYGIVLECPTKFFSNNCFPPYRLDKNKIINRSNNHNVKPNGRIDIAIYERINSFNDFQSHTAIEVKGFNPQKNKILSDLKRNAKYFGLSDVKMGSSLIKYSALVALQTYKNNDESKIMQYKNKLKKRYEGYLNEINLKGIEHTVDVSCVSEKLFNNKMNDQEMYEEEDGIHRGCNIFCVSAYH